MSDLRARLLCRTGELAGETYELSGESTIGRDRANNVVLLSEMVSGRHAKITFLDGKYFIEDLGSSNGTQLDGILITSVSELGPLSVITFAETVDCIFQIVQESVVAKTAGQVSTKKTPVAPAAPPTAVPTVVPVVVPVVVPETPVFPPTESHTRVDFGDFGSLPDLQTRPPSEELDPPPAKVDTYYLVVTIEDGPATEFPIKDGANTMGRSEDCDVVVDHRSLSRKHAVLTVDSEALTLTDLDSTNGTFLDGQEVTQQAITHGASFQLGAEVEIKLEKR